MTPEEILAAVDELLADEPKWTRGAYARDRLGSQVPARSPEAVCWCLAGALIRVAKEPAALDNTIGLLRAQLSDRNVFWFNDEATFADVKALLRKTRESGL